MELTKPPVKEDEGKSIDQVDQSLENGGGGEKIAKVNEEDIVVVRRQQTDPVFGLLMAAISFVFAYAGLALQGFGYILLWPAIDFFLLSWAYCFKGSSGHVLMGKNEETGQIGWANFLLFLPWHLCRPAFGSFLMCFESYCFCFCTRCFLFLAFWLQRH